ncbi:2-hydroxychromene-2-carboxylate isomerase [Pseudomonas sp. JUb42]|jgi:2-hydroxychromene-2-carboxylate isomerase|uniref:2-hydroxychromene-2-carboxylate isomerase n=1 Tax=Pseudomonas sp. JUb42 TaxID=2940611 RepID=UPI002168A0BE|nr:2-hydroxychromene-2-carboxylate isomerase [Pseudomonas sp. JUb42]MCS3473103.1 2-hydroxychromene-2-carboxylate isomerase [Pseudomonas sp. JUb42]
MQTVTFYFDVGSPNAYLCHKVLPQIEDRTGATFDYVPILLGGVFKLTGNQSPATAYVGIRNKLEYEHLEIRRFVKRHGLEQYRFNPHFPINTLNLMRGAIAAQRLGVFAAYIEQVYADMWERGRKMDDSQVVAASLGEVGLPVHELFTLSQSAEVKAELIANTEAAVAAGAFGSPTFLVGTELFFGKDSLRDVEEEILQQAAP